MAAHPHPLKRTIVETAGLSRVPRLVAPSLGGVGAIVAMHRVRPSSDECFQPNRSLEITPEFLDQTIGHVRNLGLDIVDLDEMQRRLEERDFKRRFVCFTLDDGYADNHAHAAPVFRAHEAPYSIYATSGFLDHKAFFWWSMLEEVIRSRDHVVLHIGGRQEHRRTGTLREKDDAFSAWHRRFRALSADAVEQAAVDLCDDYGIDVEAFCAERAMTWEMASEITDEGLGTIEAHTERHIALTRLDPDDIRADIERTSKRIAEKTGRKPKHFAYPFGDSDAAGAREAEILAELDLGTAVTMRAHVLKHDDISRRTALPRIPLNGYYQSLAYIDVVLSGLPFLLSRRGQAR